MPRKQAQPDVLVVGDHPCTYFAAALLRQGPRPPRVLHAAFPASPAAHHDRLVLLNPAFFELHPLLSALKSQLALHPIHGLKFLADDPSTRSTHTAKDVAGYVAHLRPIADAMIEMARSSKAELAEPRSVEILGFDESGVDVSVGGKRVRPRLLVIGAEPDARHRKLLGLPERWEAGVVYRYTFIRLRAGKGAAAKNPADSHSPAKVLMPMSLDLRGALLWGWLLPGKSGAQISVLQPLESVQKHDPVALLTHWAEVLVKHGELILAPGTDVARSATSMDLPLAGALVQEGVANRTLLIGPAGGFFTACAEDVYPTCWSAVFAADVALRALQEKHVQDALGAYRHKWGSTLGDFLRGPQQNLRFLMPLIYRNPTMTARLTEAILLGKSVVR